MVENKRSNPFNEHSAWSCLRARRKTMSSGEGAEGRRISGGEKPKFLATNGSPPGRLLALRGLHRLIPANRKGSFEMRHILHAMAALLIAASAPIAFIAPGFAQTCACTSGGGY